MSKISITVNGLNLEVEEADLPKVLAALNGVTPSTTTTPEPKTETKANKPKVERHEVAEDGTFVHRDHGFKMREGIDRVYKCFAKEHFVLGNGETPPEGCQCHAEVVDGKKPHCPIHCWVVMSGPRKTRRADGSIRDIQGEYEANGLRSSMCAKAGMKTPAQITKEELGFTDDDEPKKKAKKAKKNKEAQNEAPAVTSDAPFVVDTSVPENTATTKEVVEEVTHTFPNNMTLPEAMAKLVELNVEAKKPGQGHLMGQFSAPLVHAKNISGLRQEDWGLFNADLNKAITEARRGDLTTNDVDNNLPL